MPLRYQIAHGGPIPEFPNGISLQADLSGPAKAAIIYLTHRISGHRVTSSPTNSPKTLLEATRYFADPDVCLKAAIALRWGGEPV